MRGSLTKGRDWVDLIFVPVRRAAAGDLMSSNYGSGDVAPCGYI